MKRTDKAPETIDTIQLTGVTGGCAACGNPGGQCAFAQRRPQQAAPQQQ
jgi:hypothetical protein